MAEVNEGEFGESFDNRDAPAQPEMSEAGTIAGIFFEPGRVFEDLRRKPRFIVGALIIALMVTAYTFGLNYKVGEAGMRQFITEQLEKNSKIANLSKEEKDNAIRMQMTIQNYTRYAVPVFVLVFLLLGGLLYFLGTKAFGGDGGFLHSLSVWTYSSIPPTVLGLLASIVVMAIKSADEIDLAASQRGLVQANPAFLLDGKANPVLATLVATIDLFQIWGWILAAIGLRITNKLSSGSAWAIVVIIAVIGILFRVIGAIFTGNPG